MVLNPGSLASAFAAISSQTQEAISSHEGDPSSSGASLMLPFFPCRILLTVFPAFLCGMPVYLTTRVIGCNPLMTTVGFLVPTLRVGTHVRTLCVPSCLVHTFCAGSQVSPGTCRGATGRAFPRGAWERENPAMAHEGYKFSPLSIQLREQLV